MATPESKVKAKVKTILKDEHLFFFTPIGSRFGRAGIPDFVTLLPGGVFFGIETKAGKEKPTPLQLATHKLIRACGGVVLVINEENVEMVRKVIQAYRLIAHDLAALRAKVDKYYADRTEP